MKVVLKSCYLNGYALEFHYQTKRQSHLVQHSKQYHMKVLLNNFHLNGYRTGVLILVLKWLKTVSSTFQEVDFDGP